MASIETKRSERNGGVAEARTASMEVACARLKSAGLRVTQPRLAILSALVRRGLPATIEQIHGELGGTRCDLVTVYRCMSAFEGIGLVRRTFSPGGTGVYAIDLGGAPRYHVLCRRTQRMAELEAASAGDLTRALERAENSLREMGYTDVRHVVEFFGVAPPAAPG
jgi:Fur family ferric uptake transcriptional regulator